MRNPNDQRRLLAQVILLVRSRRANSRRLLAGLLRLSPTTSGQYVDQLIAGGYLRESGLEHGAMGRPKRMLETEAEAGWFAGIEFNADRIQTARVNFSGVKSGSLITTLPEGVSPSAVIAAIHRGIVALGRDSVGPLLGIGVGVPGIADPFSGVGRDYAYIEGWKDIPIAQMLRETYGVKVTVDNNLRTIALAERWFGGASDLADYVIVGPRSGFGVAIVAGGRLVTGEEHAAGEIGRWPWSNGGELQEALSAPAVWRRLAEKSQRESLPSDLRGALESLASERKVVRGEILAEYARVLGNLHLLLNAHTYFLHGPLTALGDAFCTDVTLAIRALVPSLGEKPIRLVRSQLGDDAGALGAASLAMEGWHP